MKTKYSIMIQNGEKELYRIFKDLERYGRTTFHYEDHSKQQSIARTIGIRGKSLIERDLFIPPARAKYHNINIVALPIGVNIIEKKSHKGSRFYFKKYNIF